MKIWVSPLSLVHEVARDAGPSRLVSLLSPGDIFPNVEMVDREAHHQVAVHDIRELQEGLTAPAEVHVAGVVDFLRAWSPDAPLLVHCWAGVSRSTATAFIAACIHNPDVEEAKIARTLRDASPTAWPNSRIVAIADEILSRNGRMGAAINEIGPGLPTVEADPFHIPSKFS